MLLEPDKGKASKERFSIPNDNSSNLAQSMEMLTEEVETIDEPVKTFLSFLWLWSGFFATSISLALTHEKVPDTAPLPDLVLDNIKYVMDPEIFRTISEMKGWQIYGSIIKVDGFLLLYP